MSQSAKPGLQVRRHTPPVQAEVALAPATQGLPQRPQCVDDEVRSTSQPLVAPMSQSAKPVLHEPTPHAPAAQVAVAWATVQARPQVPQLAGSSAVRRHCPLQHDWPDGHAWPSLHPATQLRVTEHTWPAGHWSSAMHPTQTWRVVSQWRESHCMSASQPASQRLAAVQYWPAVHAVRLPAVHWTQRPEGWSQARSPNSLLPQSVLSRHEPGSASGGASDPRSETSGEGGRRGRRGRRRRPRRGRSRRRRARRRACRRRRRPRPGRRSRRGARRRCRSPYSRRGARGAPRGAGSEASWKWASGAGG